MSRYGYTWRRSDDGKRVEFDGPNACHNVFAFAGLADDQLNEMARMLERAYWAGGENAKDVIRHALGAQR